MNEFFLHLAVPLLLLGGILIIFNTLIKKDTKKNEHKFKDYIELNRKADFTRTKPIENSRFIKIDISKFPLLEEKDNLSEEEKKALKLQKEVLSSCSKKMGHFKESNLELKQLYGIANLESIIEYEENYSSFMTLLFKWAKALAEANFKDYAITVLEEGISLGLDLSKAIIFLADLYKEKNDIPNLEKLYSLTKTSENIGMKIACSHIKTLL